MAELSDPFLGVNPVDPAFIADPHAALRELRETHPVQMLPIGVWRISRYADCVKLLRDTDAGMRLGDGTRLGAERLPPGADWVGEFMLSQDPPNHTRLRRLVSRAFTPRAIEKLRPHVQGVANRLLDEALEKREFDAIRGLALAVPSTVICEMMGVPLADRERFTQWTAESTHILAALFSPPDVLARALAAGAALSSYFEDLIAERRKQQGTDLISELIRAEEAGDRLSSRELLSQVMGLLVAGFETTIGLIGNGILQLIHHPDELERLRASPGLIESTVEECLRFDGPILNTLRITHEEVDLGEAVIPRDRAVMILLAAANRDPAVFTDAERFDVAREPNEHIAFGGGTHFCLGAHLARMEAQIAIGTLVRRASEIELMDEKLEWGKSLFRVLGRLPLRLTP